MPRHPAPCLRGGAVTGSRLPDFVGIGAQKAGTTWIHHQLRAHPQLFLPETKELNFFYRDLPTSWYAKHFEQAEAEQVAGEVSPNYFAQAGVAERMHALVPEARLFCILREPVARAFSQWKMARALGNIAPSTPFIEAFRRNERWLAEQGDYIALLERFTRFYPLHDRLLVLFYDDLVHSPQALISRLYAHLGVDPHFHPPGLRQVIWASEDRSTISEADRAEVAAFYADSISALEALTARDLSAWRNASGE